MTSVAVLPTYFWLRATTAIAALISLAALVGQIFNLVPMVFSLTFFGVPSVILILALVAHARRINAEVFVRCVLVGTVGGFVATLAYDVFRLLLRATEVFSYDGFKSIYIFGSWISGRPPTAAVAAAAGWFYHFWNGISFGIFYTLTFGRRHWLYGVAYGGFMEMCMLGLFPFFLRITDQVGFIAVSMMGHLVYGAVLGLVAQRYAENW